MISSARAIRGADDIWQETNRFYEISAEDNRRQAVDHIVGLIAKVDGDPTAKLGCIVLAQRSPLAAQLITDHLECGSSHLLGRIVAAFNAN